MPEKLKGSVSYGMTVNRGNYNSERYDATMEFEIENSNWEDRYYKEAFEKARKIVRDQAGVEAPE